MPKQPFWIIGTIFMPPKVEAEAQEPCPECGLPAIHVQPRVERPAYAFRCEGYHEWAIIDGAPTLKTWESGE